MALTFTGCTGTTGPSGALTGTWAEVETVPGSSLVWALTEVDTTLTGSGTYSIEAGRSGTLQISGTDSASMIVLTLTYDSGLVATFSGTLTDANHITGSLSYAGDGTVSASFIRQ